MYTMLLIVDDVMMCIVHGHNYIITAAWPTVRWCGNARKYLRLAERERGSVRPKGLSHGHRHFALIFSSMRRGNLIKI